MNPLGASSFVWVSPFTDEQLWLAPHVAELGFDVLEVCIEDPSRVTASAVERAAHETSLSVSVCGAFGPGRDVSSADERIRRQGMSYLDFCVGFAAAVGSPHVAGPMYAETGLTRLLTPDEREEQRRRAVTSLRHVAYRAGELGVRLAIEPLNRFETDLVNTVEQGLDLCDRIGLPNVGLLLDTFHMNIEERSIGDAIRRAGDRIFHVHACENDRGAPGTAHVPWAEVAAALRAVDYGGQIVVESFTPDNETIARAVSLWRPVADSPDVLAGDGLAFLQKLLA